MARGGEKSGTPEQHIASLRLYVPIDYLSAFIASSQAETRLPVEAQRPGKARLTRPRVFWNLFSRHMAKVETAVDDSETYNGALDYVVKTAVAQIDLIAGTEEDSPIPEDYAVPPALQRLIAEQNIEELLHRVGEEYLTAAES